MAKPIEIRVGPKLIWKDGAPGPAYAELQCYAREYAPDEGRISTYYADLPPVPGPACEVVSGAPFVDYSLSLHHATDDVMVLQIDITKQGLDGWRVRLSDSNDDRLDGNVHPWVDDGAGGEVPGAPAKIVVGPDGSVKVFTRPVVWVGDEEVVTGLVTLALSFSAAEISAALDVSLAGMYPAGFDTFGGEGPPPEPEPTGFWTGFRKCHEA